ncbi:hypothetical protein FCV43_13185 [Vibrio genomosp. F6]|nr:hypothetical protein DS893_03175 [Vibrionales bacterium C3R12]TKF20460.1 hypothetical protein FCV43_13185 [Vibrio genomosp. F6]
MVKSIFNLKKPLYGAFLLILTPPLVISALYYFKLQNKRSKIHIFIDRRFGLIKLAIEKN